VSCNSGRRRSRALRTRSSRMLPFGVRGSAPPNAVVGRTGPLREASTNRRCNRDASQFARGQPRWLSGSDLRRQGDGPGDHGKRHTLSASRRRSKLPKKQRLTNTTWNRAQSGTIHKRILNWARRRGTRLPGTRSCLGKVVAGSLDRVARERVAGRSSMVIRHPHSSSPVRLPAR
jgi:hypothetical protein